MPKTKHPDGKLESKTSKQPKQPKTNVVPLRGDGDAGADKNLGAGDGLGLGEDMAMEDLALDGPLDAGVDGHLDALMASADVDATEAPSGAPTYLSPGVSNDVAAGFFRATAALYRAAPWKSLPPEDSVVSVTTEDLGLQNAVVAIMVPTPDTAADRSVDDASSPGLMIFDGMDDFQAFQNAADNFTPGPAHSSSYPLRL